MKCNTLLSKETNYCALVVDEQSWVFAWLDTRKTRYAVYAFVYLLPYLRYLCTHSLFGTLMSLF